VANQEQGKVGGDEEEKEENEENGESADPYGPVSFGINATKSTDSAGGEVQVAVATEPDPALSMRRQLVSQGTFIMQQEAEAQARAREKALKE
jgi:hypothetical protein